MNETQQSNSITIANSEVLRNHNATSNNIAYCNFNILLHSQNGSEMLLETWHSEITVNRC